MTESTSWDILIWFFSLTHHFAGKNLPKKAGWLKTLKNETKTKRYTEDASPLARVLNRQRVQLVKNVPMYTTNDESWYAIKPIMQIIVSHYITVLQGILCQLCQFSTDLSGIK